MKNIFPGLLVLALLIATSCNNQDYKYEILTATLKGPSAISMIYMIEEKPLLEEKYQCQFNIESEPQQVIALILDEQVDFAVLPLTSAAILFNKTGKYILAAVPVMGTLYLCGNDTSILDWNDLKGKKIHLMGQGMTPDVMFRFLAEKNGHNPDTDFELNYSFNGHIELANALSAGIVDFGVISEPMASMVLARNQDIHTIINFHFEWEKLFDASIPFAQTALLVNKEFAQNHPELVNTYLAEIEKSTIRVNSNPSEAAELIVKHGILPEKSIAEKSIPLSNIRYLDAGKEMEGINEYLKVFLNFNPLIIGGKLPDEGFYYKKENL